MTGKTRVARLGRQNGKTRVLANAHPPTGGQNMQFMQVKWLRAAGAAGAAGGATIWPKPTGEENMQFMQVKWLRSNALTGKTRVARLGRQKTKRVF